MCYRKFLIFFITTTNVCFLTLLHATEFKIFRDSNKSYEVQKDTSLEVFEKQLKYYRDTKKIVQILKQYFPKELSRLIFNYLLQSKIDLNDTSDLVLSCSCGSEIGKLSPAGLIPFDYIDSHKQTQKHKEGEKIQSQNVLEFRKKFHLE